MKSQTGLPVFLACLVFLLGVTVSAVKFHLQHIYEKLHVHSRPEAALKFKQGQVSEN